MKTITSTLARCLCGIGLIVILQPAQAALLDPLNLTQDFPDFFIGSTGDLDFSYSRTTGVLGISATGISTFTAFSGDDQDPVGATTGTGGFEGLTMSVTLDTTTGNVLSGTFQIDGVVRDLTSPSTILYDGTSDSDGLLSGFITDIGVIYSTDTSGFLEFSFDSADGVIFDAFGISSGGMIFSLGVNFSGKGAGSAIFGDDLLTVNWSDDDTNTFQADIFTPATTVIPVPAAVWLFGSGLVALTGFAGRRNKKVA